MHKYDPAINHFRAYALPSCRNKGRLLFDQAHGVTALQYKGMNASLAPDAHALH